MGELNYYYSLIQQSKIIQKFIQTMPILNDIYGNKFFERIRKQIVEMKRLEVDGPIDSMFLLMLDDNANDFKKVKLIEKYLYLIFNHPSAKKSDIKYVKKELAGNQALNTLFEVNIIGNFLNQCPSTEIELYPKTYENKNVDLAVTLFNRPIYLEITVLGESVGDRNVRERMSRNKIHVWSGSRDIARDTIRFSSKINDKLKQFSAEKPNVLIVSKFDFFPVKFNIDIVMRNTCFRNVGTILQFNRKSLEKIHEQNLDPDCVLTKQELAKLREIVSEHKYNPIYYGTT